MSCGTLELELLNTYMGMTGILFPGQLRFYTRVSIYGVTFGPSGAYMIERFNRFLGNWEDVMFSGTLGESTNALNQFGPFLTLSEANEIWGGINIPPENVNAGFIFNPN